MKSFRTEKPEKKTVDIIGARSRYERSQTETIDEALPGSLPQSARSVQTEYFSITVYHIWNSRSLTLVQ